MKLSESELEALLNKNPKLKVTNETNIEKIAKQPSLDLGGNKLCVRFTLPFPPATNNLFATAWKTKRRFPSERYVKWKEKANEVLDTIPTQILTGDLSISMWIYRPKKIGDWDGYIKAPQDILHDRFFLDDKQIVEGHIYRLDDKLNPRIEIEIREIN